MNEKIKQEIEYDLNRYKRFNARLKEIKNQLNNVSVGGTSWTEDKVQESGLKMDVVTKNAIEHEKLEREYFFIDKKVKQIENGLEALSEEERLIIMNRYMKGIHRKRTLAELNIDKTSYYTILYDGLKVYAEVTGRLPIIECVVE